MSEKPDEKCVSRRDAMRSMAAAGAALTIGSSTGTAAENNQQISYEGLELPYPNAQIKKLHSSVRGVTNHPELLTLPRNSLTRHLEASGLEGRRFGEAQKYVSNLQKRYPVERLKDGNVTIIKLSDESDIEAISASNADNPRLHTDVIKALSGEGPSVPKTQWKRSQHEDITLKLMNDTGYYSSTTVAASDDPDDFGTVAKGKINDISDQIETSNIVEEITKDVVADVIKSVLNMYHTNWAQYFDPDVNSWGMGDAGTVKFKYGLGKAPQAGDVFFEESISNSSNKKLGYSLHYLQDCAQPLHTGMGAEQAGFEVQGISNGNINFYTSPKKWLHSGFEFIVMNNWKRDPPFGGKKLINYVTQAGSPSRIYSAEQAIKDMAGVSSAFSFDIYNTIYQNQTKDQAYYDWKTSTKRNIYQDLANCYATLGYLGHGFVEEYQR